MKKLLFAGLLFTSVSLISCSGGFIVTERPARPIYTRPVAPGPDYIWIEGDYGRGGWGQGHWERGRAGRTWHSGDWEQHGNGYRWRRGHW